MTVYVGEVPGDPIRDQLRALLRDPDMHAEDAAEAVLAPYGEAPLAGDARAMVLSMAQQLERRRGKSVERAVSDGTARADTRMRLREVRWRTGQGVTVTWATATLADHEARAAWCELVAEGYWRDADMHRRAAKILADHDAETLAEVDGWEDLLRERSDDDSTPGDRSHAGHDPESGAELAPAT